MTRREGGGGGGGRQVDSLVRVGQGWTDVIDKEASALSYHRQRDTHTHSCDTTLFG